MARFDSIIGRYVYLTLNGREHRVYFEEAGHGIPLLCLHTAASDSRQYRHLMTDADVTAHFRVMCFDLPWHGKSSPPDGWQQDEYRLTTDAYVEVIRAFCSALKLDRPVVLGCSIGGRIVLTLASRHGAEFRALIALAGAAAQTSWYDSSWLYRPDVHGGDVCAGIVSGLIAPQSPDASRWETLWCYMQSGSGVFKGDIYFYGADPDLRERVAAIDTSIAPLYLMAGEYDFSCTVDDARRTHQLIPGSQLITMPELGHFPMCENPARFRGHILPVLEEIRARKVEKA